MTDRDHRQADPGRWQRLWSLLAPHHDRAVLTARRLSADSMEGDDLFQEAVLRAYRKLDGLRDESRFRSWFYAVLLSLHRTRSRWSFWRRFAALEPLVESAREPAAEDVGVSLDETWRARRVSRALSALPAVQRQAVVLHDLDGYTMEEIAEAQDVSVSAAKSRVSRGRRRLRRRYERWGFRDERIAPPREARMTLAPSGGVERTAGAPPPGGSR